MNANEFEIFSGWEPRAETAERLGQRMLKNLDALTAISPYFCDWNFLDFKRPLMEMNENNYREYEIPLEKVRGQMTEIVEQGVRKNDYGKPEPGGGYSITASNDDQDRSRYVSLRAHGGGIVDPRAGLRFANFKTASDIASDPAIVAYPVFKAALMSVVSAWEVGHAQAYSGALSNLWNKPHKHFLDLAWMTYLSPALARKVTAPSDVLVEHTADGGLLMIAAKETFDTANPGHMAAARSILQSLAGLNVEAEEECNRLWPPWQPPR